MSNYTWTTAPVDYDGFGTRTVRIAGYDSRSRPVRLVETPTEHVDWQRHRYWSGAIYLVVHSEERWRELVENNLATECYDSIRFRATLADGTVVEGPIQGNGGRLGSGALHAGREAARREAAKSLALAQRNARRNRPVAIYEPQSKHVAMYPAETPEDQGEPVAVPLLDTVFEVLP